MPPWCFHGLMSGYCEAARLRVCVKDFVVATVRMAYAVAAQSSALHVYAPVGGKCVWMDRSTWYVRLRCDSSGVGELYPSSSPSSWWRGGVWRSSSSSSRHQHWMHAWGPPMLACVCRTRGRTTRYTHNDAQFGPSIMQSLFNAFNEVLMRCGVMRVHYVHTHTAKHTHQAHISGRSLSRG